MRTNDYERALAELSQAERLLPNSAEVWQTRGIIYNRQDKIRERIVALRRAETLDPRDLTGFRLLGRTLRCVRDWPAAEQTRDRVLALYPSLRSVRYASALDEFRRTGKMNRLKQLMTEAPTGRAVDTQEDYMFYQFHFAMLERDFVTAERLLRELPAKHFGLDSHPKAIQEVLLVVGRGGDRASVERTLMSAREEFEKLMAAAPDVSDSYTNLGLIDAFLGRKEEAIREGRRGVELASVSMLEKNTASAALALINARTGESDQAIELIEHLLTVPANLFLTESYNMTVAELKWRWEWDPLRSDPRFQKILEGPKPKTIY